MMVRGDRRRLLLGAAAAALTGAVAAQQPLRVVASFSILADIARNCGGSAVDVRALVGPDADAHAFQPTPADARRIAQAELVVVNGLSFEGWIDRLIAASGYRGPVLVASAGITPRRDGVRIDPHAWQDLGHARRYAANLRDALVGLRPAQADALRAQAAAYIERLEALDREARQRFAAVAPERRRAITSHDAFGYLGAAYGIEFLAPRGWSTASEPSARQVARLIEQLKAERVRALFVENISDPRLVERIAREGGAVVGGALYSDALSAPGSEAGTYLELYAHNVATIAAGLLGRCGA